MSGRLVKSSSRGQALVLFALTLLLLALMVLLTLGFGVRAKEHIELQMATDAAAYSQAVATARTFNAISVMNRAQVAHMVAMAGTQALISRSSQVFAAHSVCQTAFPQPMWHVLDTAAANQTRSLQGRAGGLYRAGLNIYASLLRDHIQGQKLALSIARAANGELQATPEGAAKSFSELNGAEAVPEHGDLMNAARRGDARCGGAVCAVGGGSTSSLNATMGSLGWTWVHNRPTGSAGFGTGGAAQSTAFRHYGSAGSMDPSTYDTVSGRNSWGHDHGNGVLPTRCVNTPPGVVPVSDAWVMSDEEQTHEDQHVYGVRAPPGQTPEDGKPMYEQHTLGACVVCPGIWPFSMAYNVDELRRGEANQYGQPKLYAVIHRDYGSDQRRAHPDPWNLFFRFRFSQESDTEFDNAIPLGRSRPTGRESVQRNQVALSAGIVYYHRPYAAAAGGGWREPPNFLNPFWRATLVSAEGADDDKPANSLSTAGFAEHARVLRELEEAGYRGGSRRGAGY
ncbi:pilus assembly protein [Myxococcus stipitatus]|uniref:pilus assembly protein n=1 Tax=Myxococcus stipitatus TaxID=83455 RepID=UPI001F22A4C4|nr:pilus assembly protein [Myxococcus stipitatus]MCE9669220.1 pilus assembly protein [Myxococcus stipitatus]